jgi:hypothetical protein
MSSAALEEYIDCKRKGRVDSLFNIPASSNLDACGQRAKARGVAEPFRRY